MGGGEQWAEHSAARTPRFSGSRGQAGRPGGGGRAAHRGVRSQDVIRFGWPVGVTPQAESMRHLWTWSADRRAGRRRDHLGRDVLGGGLAPQAQGHRRRHVPRQTQYNLPVELVFTVVPTIIVAVLFGFTVNVQNYVDDRPAQTPRPQGRRHRVPVELEVRLPRPHGRRRAAGQHAGHQRHDPAAGAADRPSIQFTQHSNDVIHSFFVPEFLFKRDVFPLPAGQRPGQHLDDRPASTARARSSAAAPSSAAATTRR